MPKEGKVDEVEDLVDDDELVEDDEDTEEEETVPTVGAGDVARMIGVDPKVFRRFIRATVVKAGGVVGIDTPGSGGRYAFPEAEVEQLIEQFNAWQAGPKSTRKTVVIDVDDADLEDDESDEEEFILDEENSTEEDEVEEDDEGDEDIEELA